jgi:hypothetical protein
MLRTFKILNSEEIENRKPLWEAMSELWIDTAPADHQYLYIAEVMGRSNYSLDELEQICFREVAPVVCGNLLNVAGVWSGFDAAWLFNNILLNLQKQQQNPFYRWWVQSKPGKFAMTRMIQKDWEKVIDLYKFDYPDTKNKQ